jgi:hypothetical protein
MGSYEKAQYFNKFGRQHRYSMAVGTAKTIGTVIAPTQLNTVPTAWPSAQSMPTAQLFIFFLYLYSFIY